MKVTESSVLLFTTRQGARTSISRRAIGDASEFVIDGAAAGEKLSQSQLLAEVDSHPERFSPNVLLRPIMQDFLLPTLAYTGGAAEAAYFAQAGVVYEALLGRVTPILPRFSATIIEPKAQRLLEKHDLTLTDVFEGPEALRQRIAAMQLPRDLQAAFDAAKKSFEVNIPIFEMIVPFKWLRLCQGPSVTFGSPVPRSRRSRAGRFAVSTGRATRTSVPARGLLHMPNRAPIFSARPRIPRRPQCESLSL